MVEGILVSGVRFGLPIALALTASLASAQTAADADSDEATFGEQILSLASAQVTNIEDGGSALAPRPYRYYGGDLLFDGASAMDTLRVNMVLAGGARMDSDDMEVPVEMLMRVSAPRTLGFDVFVDMGPRATMLWTTTKEVVAGATVGAGAVLEGTHGVDFACGVDYRFTAATEVAQLDHEVEVSMGLRVDF